jgi:hypothetical protein
MRERGQYQIQLMKTRSSSGVGQKIDLSFNIDTLRIFDDGSNDTGYTPNQSSGSSILNKIKASSTVVNTQAADSSDVSGESAKRVTANVQSSKLNAMLNQLKTNS